MTPPGRPRVARLFDGISRLYDTEVLQRLVYRPAQDMALGELRAAGSSRVLDVGCGTGIFAARVRNELGGKVLGCDLSAGMLAQAAARSRDVLWIRGDATRLPVSDSSVDAVVCTEAFHFFDQSAALAEFNRVLEPGGRLLIALINPRTDIASRLLRAQASRALGTGTWPTRTQMDSMVSGAGFDVMSQQRVGRVLARAIPTVLTVAIRPIPG